MKSRPILPLFSDAAFHGIYSHYNPHFCLTIYIYYYKIGLGLVTPYKYFTIPLAKSRLRNNIGHIQNLELASIALILHIHKNLIPCHNLIIHNDNQIAVSLALSAINLSNLPKKFPENVNNSRRGWKVAWLDFEARVLDGMREDMSRFGIVTTDEDNENRNVRVCWVPSKANGLADAASRGKNLVMDIERGFLKKNDLPNWMKYIKRQ